MRINFIAGLAYPASCASQPVNPFWMRSVSALHLRTKDISKERIRAHKRNATADEVASDPFFDM